MSLIGCILMVIGGVFSLIAFFMAAANFVWAEPLSGGNRIKMRNTKIIAVSIMIMSVMLIALLVWGGVLIYYGEASL